MVFTCGIGVSLDFINIDDNRTLFASTPPSSGCSDLQCSFPQAQLLLNGGKKVSIAFMNNSQ